MAIAPVMCASQQLATLHALAILATGLVWAAQGRLDRVAYVAAYILGAEVLWRMADADVNWEFGKYAIGFVFVVSILAARLKLLFVPTLYFALLIPAIALAVVNGTPGEVQSDVSFNLSGPFLLMVSVCFFAQLRLTRQQLLHLCLVAICPLAGIAVNTLFHTFSGPKIEFTSQSNMAITGDISPNQVSAVLGLGALFVLLIMMHERARGMRPLLLAVMLMFIAQSIMTFSRGGIYLAGAAAVTIVIYMLPNPRAWPGLLVTGLVAGLLLVAVVFPWLNQFSDGALETRFSDTSSTGRYEILMADLEIWKRNPVLGVGTGQAKSLRAEFFKTHSAHTEYSRLLAEHGLFGLAAGCLIFGMGGYAMLRWRQASDWPVGAAMMIWSLLVLSIYGMRLAAPSFLFGLAFVHLSTSFQTTLTPSFNAVKNHWSHARLSNGLTSANERLI